MSTCECLTKCEWWLQIGENDIKLMILPNIELSWAGGMLLSYTDLSWPRWDFYAVLYKAKLQFGLCSSIQRSLRFIFSAREVRLAVFSISGRFLSCSSGTRSSQALMWSMRGPLLLGTDLWMFLFKGQEASLIFNGTEMWRREEMKKARRKQSLKEESTRKEISGPRRLTCWQISSF